jgi:hypothetical protein
LKQGFLLDRARLVVVPIGLEVVVRALSEADLYEPAGLDMGKRILERLMQVLHQDGLARRLHVRIDSPLGGIDLCKQGMALSSWDATASAKNQIKAAGVLHSAAQAVTAALCLAKEELPAADQVVDWIRLAWTQSEIMRLQVVRVPAMECQLTPRGKCDAT